MKVLTLLLTSLAFFLHHNKSAVLLSTETCDIPGSPDDMFILFNEEIIDFDKANGQCIKEGGFLASIFSKEELDYVTDFILQNLPSKDSDGNNQVLRGRVWLGIKDLNEAPSPVNSASTNRFSFIDGSDSTFFNGNPRESPWIPSDPNNNGGGGKLEDCVVVVQERDGNIGIADVECAKKSRYLCRVPCNITEAPTLAPTHRPTTTPTISPTQSPTAFPTASPTTLDQLVDDNQILSGDNVKVICSTLAVSTVVALLWIKKSKMDIARMKKKQIVVEENLKRFENKFAAIEIPQTPPPIRVTSKNPSLTHSV